MPQHPDPAWVAVGRAICDLVLDSGLDVRGQRPALDFAQELLWDHERPVSPVSLQDVPASAAKVLSPPPPTP